jgi:hypothetical protein
MSITVRCPGCGKSYQLLDEQAGLRVRCRECKSAFEVPKQPERLEVVKKLPAARGPRLPDEDAPVEPPALARKSTTHRTLLWVAAIFGAFLLVGVLGCGGIAWWITKQWRPTIEQIARPPEPPPDKPPEKPPPQVAKSKDPQITIPEVKLPTFKDLDDAVRNLRSPDRLTRLAALKYIGTQKPPANPEKKKQVLAAVNALANDEDLLIMGAANLVRINWGEFD